MAGPIPGWRRLAVFAAAVLTVASAQGQSVLEFDRWMQQIDRHSQDVLRHIQRGEPSAALVDARELARLYRRMEEFYQQRGHADDAVLASFVGRDQAEQAAQALEANRPEEAYAQASALARDCRNCHLQYKPMRD